MLSRTADNLYWLARYVERAEYLARILEVTQRLTTLPLAYVGSSNEWESAVATAGCAHAFAAAYPEANEEAVTDFLCFSSANPSSIRNCFEIARTNARAVRTALTVEMWDAINGTWLELRRFGNGPTSRSCAMKCRVRSQAATRTSCSTWITSRAPTDARGLLSIRRAQYARGWRTAAWKRSSSRGCTNSSANSSMTITASAWPLASNI